MTLSSLSHLSNFFAAATFMLAICLRTLEPEERSKLWLWIVIGVGLGLSFPARWSQNYFGLLSVSVQALLACRAALAGFPARIVDGGSQIEYLILLVGLLASLILRSIMWLAFAANVVLFLLSLRALAAEYIFDNDVHFWILTLVSLVLTSLSVG